MWIGFQRTPFHGARIYWVAGWLQSLPGGVLLDRESDTEGRAFSGLAVDFDLAIVLAQDAVRD